MDLYKNYLVIFGGSGAYNKVSKMRICNNELHFFDLYKQKWEDNLIKHSNEEYIPKQRMYHASAVYGECLLINGGINTDDKIVYNDIFLFNLERKEWVELVGSKKWMELIGARQMHTITTVIPQNLLENEIKNLWISQSNTISEILDYQNWGMYLFGGYKENEGQMNDLWLIKPNFEIKNDKKKSKTNKVAIHFYSIEGVKLEPDGKQPTARVLHTTVYIKNRYLLIFGGKSK